ncbi:MAG: hypothetical protein WCA81_00215 [Rhizomicrobium sp.]|jgi:hypothetical protein
MAFPPDATIAQIAAKIECDGTNLGSRWLHRLFQTPETGDLNSFEVCAPFCGQLRAGHVLRDLLLFWDARFTAPHQIPHVNAVLR